MRDAAEPGTPGRRTMKLGLFVEPYGRHIAAWRHPDATRDAPLSFRHFVTMAETAERGRFDFMFIADTNNVWDNMGYFSRSDRGMVLDPMQLLAALAVSTQHIGLIATTSTTYTQPFHVARTFASLDHLSGGRAGWNLVTSMFAGEAQQFGGAPHMAHADRYARAEEYVDVVRGLWNSWDEGAFVQDQESGLFFEPSGLHVLHHKGDHFGVRGPLNIPRTPQGQPVIVQAGSSEPGQNLSARTAEVVFAQQQTMVQAQTFYASLKGRMDRFGRRPEELAIMPGAFLLPAKTESEAQEKYQMLQELVHPEVGLSLLSGLIGADLMGADVDAPLPDLPATNGGTSHQKVLVDRARRDGLTVRQLYEATVGGRGHWELVGTPEQIVDQLEERFLAHACDGFNVMPPFPGALDDIVDMVIPELRRRGLVDEAYRGRTLRENLGMTIPARVA
ncbi:MAG: nitrilotriacetate monooxygenase [Rhodobacteraceae bacterium]|nr:nitrilotriacetate monooxygenase [Paracoccaceae bacterium]